MSVYEEKESYAASRSGGLGGTDVAAILGLSPWKSPINVYAAKVNPSQLPELDKEMLWWGRALEPIVRERYEVRFGVEVASPLDVRKHFPLNHRPWNDDATLVIGDEPWKIAAPDGWIPQGRCVYEGKCSARKSAEWGEEGSDEVPVHYFVQDAWYMHIMDATACNYGVLFSGNTLQQYRSERDPLFERDMVTAARAFWHDNVLKEVEPKIDESESYGRYLARKFSLGNGSIIENPGPEIIHWASEMKLADDECKQAEERKQLANNNLRALIADAEKAKTPLGTVGWVRSKPQMLIDWESVAMECNAPSGLIEAHTSIRPREPYLRVWWRK